MNAKEVLPNATRTQSVTTPLVGLNVTANLAFLVMDQLALMLMSVLMAQTIVTKTQHVSTMSADLVANAEALLTTSKISMVMETPVKTATNVKQRLTHAIVKPHVAIPLVVSSAHVIMDFLVTDTHASK